MSPRPDEGREVSKGLRGSVSPGRGTRTEPTEPKDDGQMAGSTEQGLREARDMRMEQGFLEAESREPGGEIGV